LPDVRLASFAELPDVRLASFAEVLPVNMIAVGDRDAT
jgi:hypothetical protein